MKLRAIGIVAQRDLRRRVRDPVGLLLWAAFPLAVALLVRLAFGGGDSEKIQPARVALADEDSTLVSRLVLGAFGQGPAQSLFTPVRADSAGAVALARKGSVAAAVIIPRGFSDAYLEGRTARLVLYKNPEQRVLPGIVEQSTGILAEAAFYLRGMFKEPLERIRRATTESVGAQAERLTVADIAVEINDQIRTIRPYLLPPVLTVDFRTKEHAGMGGNYFFLLFPGLLLMALLFVSQALAQDIWVEHRRGTLRRNLTTPHGIAPILFGKVLAGLGVLAGIYTLVLVAGALLFRLQLHHIASGFLFGVAAGFAILSVLYVLVTLAQTENSATMLTSLIIMPSILLGGSFFPIESMPRGLQNIALHTPNGWMRGVLKNAFLGQGSSSPAWIGALICIAVGLVSLLIAGRFARRRFVGG